MSEVSKRYGQLADAFAAKIAAVPADKWSSPSPCAGWTARDVVGHVISTQGMFLGFIDQKLSDDVPSVDDDPLAAWNGARAQVQSSLEDPQRAQTEFEGFTGRSTFEAGVDRFLCFDLVVHGWDLARATGQDETVDPAEVKRVREAAEAFGPAMRSPQAFGPEVDAPAGADDQAKLLAFLGRKP